MYQQPQSHTYILQQNPYATQQGPQWSTSTQYPIPQPQYQPNYLVSNPYDLNPSGQNPTWTGWNVHTGPYQIPPMNFNTQLPFLAMLELLDVSKLTNDPILHNPYWPPVPTKIPSDCPKIEGKPGEDPQTHVMTYHLWCSSNSWVDDSLRLHLFQQTLTRAAAKWYIQLSRGVFQDFNSLAMAFLTHF